MAASTTSTLSFPTAFPTACISIAGTVGTPLPTSGVNNLGFKPVNAGQYQCQNGDSVNAHNGTWIAVGY
jgi:hypothetical protein